MGLREVAHLEALGGDPFSLLGVKLSGDLRGLMFEATVEQRFCNPGDTNVEVVYSFPLPWGAVLLGVDVVLGDKHLTGAVVKKKRADASYEEAISEGNAAIMLEKNRDHSYSLNLGNLAAREHCTITLRYAQTLQFEQRGLRLLLPAVIAPRYGDAQQDGGLQPHQAPSHSLLVEHPFALELRLHGDLVQARVASPSHPVSVVHAKAEEGGVMTVSLARQASLDRDFVLVVDQLAHDSMVVAALDSVSPDVVAILASFCPRIATQDKASTAVKILVDCSGSMAGDSINAAKRALQAIVRQLGAGDRFSLSRFGSTVEHRSRGLWKTTETTQLAAQRWVGALDADLGGTAMEAALTSTFALAQTVSSDILLVTDGEISAIDRTIASARDSGHRLFIVGIGSSPAETHLRRLAEATGGACDFVAPGEAVEPAVLRMFARLRSPRLANLNIEWPAGTAPLWVSPLLPSVFDGDTVNVFALLGQAPAGQVRLQGQRAEDQEPQEIGCASFTGEMEAGDTLARMAVSSRLGSTNTYAAKAAKFDAVSLAVTYQLVTEKTNFLLVHERADSEKAADMPELQKIQQMVPAGWGGMSSLSYSRSGAITPGSDRRNAADASSMSIPSVWRALRRPAASVSVDDIDDWDDLDVPAFLRKQSDVTQVGGRKLNQIMSRKDGRYWMHSENYKGLTPLGLSEWLQLTPREWPTTYEGLRQLGLGAWLVDWLELVMGAHDGAAYPEHRVVYAFLFLMSRKITLASLNQSGGRVDASKSMGIWLSAQMRREPLETSGDVEPALVEAMAKELNRMTATAWPEDVFSLGYEREEKCELDKPGRRHNPLISMQT